MTKGWFVLSCWSSAVAAVAAGDASGGGGAAVAAVAAGGAAAVPASCWLAAVCKDLLVSSLSGLLACMLACLLACLLTCFMLACLFVFSFRFPLFVRSQIRRHTTRGNKIESKQENSRREADFS